MTVISDLTQVLVEKILSSVPITSLGAVRSTCKQWNALSKEQILFKTEERQQFLGFMMKKYKLCSVRFYLHGILNEEGEEFVDPSIKEIDNVLNQEEISQVFHCDGLLLCVTRDNLVVWNPYLGQTRWIKPRNTYHRLDRYAIGYDNNKNRNHKILRFLDDDLGYDNFFGYEIYDFSSNSWRVLDITPNWDIEHYQRGVSLKGNTYFFAKEKLLWEEIEEEMVMETPDFLISFDFTKERFGQFLPLPFEHSVFDTGVLSSLRDEKLAALYQCLNMTEVEIWVTTKIEPNAVVWIPFLKVDMEPFTGFGFQFCTDGGSFYIDDEKKVVVVFQSDKSEMSFWYDSTYIIGENGYLKKLDLNHQESVYYGEFAAYCLLLCSSSYVPSLVQINQIAEGKKRKR